MKVAPLSGSLMVTSMMGFLVSVLWLSKYSATWSFTVALISVIIFVATMISVTKAPIEEELALDSGAVRFVKRDYEAKGKSRK